MLIRDNWPGTQNAKVEFPSPVFYFLNTFWKSAISINERGEQGDLTEMSESLHKLQLVKPYHLVQGRPKIELIAFVRVIIEIKRRLQNNWTAVYDVECLPGLMIVSIVLYTQWTTLGDK